MQLYMPWYIIYFFWLYLYFLNILYFFKYSCTNIFHIRSLNTFFWAHKIRSIVIRVSSGTFIWSLKEKNTLRYHWTWKSRKMLSLQWRHNDHDGVSNHQPHGCLLNRLFRRRSKKISKLRFTGLCAGNSPGPVNSPHKGPVTRKMCPFDDVIMLLWKDTISKRTGRLGRFRDHIIVHASKKRPNDHL